MQAASTPPVKPWGLGRMSPLLLEDMPLYKTIRLDPVTQISHFYDGHGNDVLMGEDSTSKTYVTVTMSRGGGGDGSGGAAQVADDSNNDMSSD